MARDASGAATEGGRWRTFGRHRAASAGSNLVAGIVVAQRLPWLLFTLVSGALVEQLDRRLALGGANLCRAALIAVLGLATLTSWANLPILYSVFFLLGTAETLSDNAALAILPAIVPANQLERANGRIFAAQTVASEFAGPPLGGALFALLAAAPFLVNAGSYAVARQSVIPDRLLGRVTSAYRLLVLGALPTGALCGGFLARSFDLLAPYWVGGVALMAMAFALLPLINDGAIAQARAAGTSS